ncbi:MAG: hypothetical protein IKI84_01775 [Clostridia bacterium]|nr:hypothetical protein [Clostridia bacterium]
MSLSSLLGLPLDEALSLARTEGLKVDRVVMTGARGSARQAAEREGGFEERVVSCGEDYLIAARFRTSAPMVKTGEENVSHE